MSADRSSRWSADRSSASLTETNAMVAPLHPKAMPVILTTR